MEPPLPAPPFSAAVAAAGNISYPNSVDSSPRSRNADSWDEPPFPSTVGGAGAKLRVMCSYGGHIIPRPHDKSLCYAGGDTRIVVADRRSTLADLTHRLSKTLLNGRPFTLKYQLPNEDLDSLISVTTDEDLENMIDEYDRLTAAGKTTQKSSRLRLFLFPEKSDSASSIGSLSLLENSTKSEDWFLNAINGGFPESASVNCLLGLDDDVLVAGNPNSSVKDVEAQPESFLDTTSSFGSASSSPSLANLPPIRVHVEDHKAAAAVGGGIEEHFSQMTVAQKQDDRGFLVKSQPQPPSQPKPIGGVDLASPNSVSSDNSTANPLSGQRAVIYQDPIVQNSRIQMQQVHDSTYMFPTQFDQQRHQLNPPQQQQQQQQQQQHFVQAQQLNPQQHQQFIQAGTHYIHNHGVPITSYYPLYPPQQHSLDQQYLSYCMASRQAQAYNYPVRPSNFSEPAVTVSSTCSQTPPPSSIASSAAYNASKNLPASKTEMGGGIYTAAPPLVQVPSSQHQPQYVGFSQLHHPSQSLAHTSAATANYGYEFADPAQPQMYYPRPLPP